MEEGDNERKRKGDRSILKKKKKTEKRKQQKMTEKERKNEYMN